MKRCEVGMILIRSLAIEINSGVVIEFGQWRRQAVVSTSHIKRAGLYRSLMSENWICGLEIQETYSSSSVANVLRYRSWRESEIILGKKGGKNISTSC